MKIRWSYNSLISTMGLYVLVRHLCTETGFWRPFQDKDAVLPLTHWGRVTHICVSELTTIGSDNGLSPGRRQAIIWSSAGILWIGPLGTNFRENLIRIQTFAFKKMPLNMSSAKWRPFCLGLNVLIENHCGDPGGRLNKKDGLTRYGNSHVKDKTS